MALKWRYILFFLAIGTGSVLQSQDAREYPWAHYAANAIILIAVVAFAASKWCDEGKVHHDTTADGEYSTPGDPRHVVTKTFVVVTRAALIVAIVLAGMTSVFSYLSAVSAEGPKCAGREWVEGYDNGMYNFWGIPLGSAFIVMMVGRCAIGRRERLRRMLELYDLPVLKFASMQVTLGEFMAYGVLLIALVALGILTGGSVTQYNAIVMYCLAATAFN
jgi:hypothetical protein